MYCSHCTNPGTRTCTYVFVWYDYTSPHTFDLWLAVVVKNSSVYIHVYTIGLMHCQLRLHVRTTRGSVGACNFRGFVHGRNCPADISLGTEYSYYPHFTLLAQLSICVCWILIKLAHNTCTSNALCQHTAVTLIVVIMQFHYIISMMQW